MRAPRSAVLAVTAWLAVVLVGSTLVWTVISRAGQEVQGGTELRAAPTRAGSSPASVHPISPGHTLSAKPTPSGRPGRSQPASPDGSSAAPSSTPGPPSTSRGTSGYGSGGSSTAPAPVPTRRGTWSGTGGTVTVACTGATISLVGATPEDGYSVEVEKDGSHLEAKFKRQGEDEREVTVEARCSGGAPRFSVDTD